MNGNRALNNMHDRRVILIVLDSLGVGAMDDAESFGDKGADTFGHIVDMMPGIKIPNLLRLGFGNINGAAGGRMTVHRPIGSFGRMKEISLGKDTITGHWEIAGIRTSIPFKTYPDGFPSQFIKEFEKEIGRKVIGNYAESGTVIIDQLGSKHEATGRPIVYTSADSVFQIAANVDVISIEELYAICKKAREMLVGEWACGRVIARPYKITNGNRERTSDRHDFAVDPPESTILNRISKSGMEVVAIGKIVDIFNGKGITRWKHTKSNSNGVDVTLREIKKNYGGLIFVNLVDFDSKYGHRRDIAGYGRALEEFDLRLPEILNTMGSQDVLCLCADHGNDPAHSGFDHTREYIPFVIFGSHVKAGINLGTGESFANIGATIEEYLGIERCGLGESQWKKVDKTEICK